MFVERFDALMNIAELSNSQLGRDNLGLFLGWHPAD